MLVRAQVPATPMNLSSSAETAMGSVSPTDPVACSTASGTGRKTGGRQTGVPNRRTVEAQEILSELGCDPIEGMARIAIDVKHTPN